MNKEYRLYNVLFPVWFLLLFPITWLVVLPANFIIDSVVLLLCWRLLQVQAVGKHYKQAILRVWLLGFAADFIGAAFLLLSQSIDSDWWYEYILSPVAFNPFDNLFSFAYVLVAVLVAGVCIYLLNMKFAFARLELPRQVKQKTALALALFTAPYLFFMPSQILHGNGQVDFFTNHLVSTGQYQPAIATGQADADGLFLDVPIEHSIRLRRAVNTASRLYGKQEQQREADYTLLFYAQREPIDRTLVHLWVEEQPVQVILRTGDKWYHVEEAQARELAQLLSKLASGEAVRSDFTILDQSTTTPAQPQLLYEDAQNSYYLTAGNAEEIFVVFDNGDQVDLQKALDAGLVTIGQLMESRLSIEARPR